MESPFPISFWRSVPTELTKSSEPQGCLQDDWPAGLSRWPPTLQALHRWAGACRGFLQGWEVLLKECRVYTDIVQSVVLAFWVFDGNCLA